MSSVWYLVWLIAFIGSIALLIAELCCLGLVVALLVEVVLGSGWGMRVGAE